MKKFFVSCFLFLISYFSFAQVEMADELRSSGKIYVVVAVLCVIFLGIIIYLFGIDKKISKMENEKSKNS